MTPTRRATIRTEHDRPDLVAAALEPDNTDEMSTHVEPADDGTGASGDHGVVVTTIERDTAGGLRTTADDYVTNLQVAQAVLEDATEDTNTDATTGNGATDTIETTEAGTTETTNTNTTETTNTNTTATTDTPRHDHE